MRGPAAIVACWFAGCGFSTQLPGTTGDDGGTTDAMADAHRLDGCTTFSTIVDTCALGAYGPQLSITGARKYDTGTHVLSNLDGSAPTTPTFAEVMIGGAPITVLVVDGFRIEDMASLRVVGPRAFGVVSTADVTIIGLLDGTGTPEEGGAGSRGASACGLSMGRDGNDNNAVGGGASGGGGGGFQTAGAKGGTGDNNNDQIEGANGGTAVTAPPTSVIGGCPGGGGGDALLGNGRTGGDGGAGVFVTSAAGIEVTGQINVGGGGGSGGGALYGGGAGGGSGGLVLLESPDVAVAGVVAANGGGGGGGANDTNDGGTGTAGRASAMTANGGGAPNSAGAGGAGGAMTQPTPMQPGSANAGGGGGGGGVGFVFIVSAAPNVTGTISPGLSTWP